jgi:hypothetical protein
VKPEQVRDIYYEALHKADLRGTTGQPCAQAQMQEMAWEAVIKAIRTHYEQENERLREENRGLGKALVQALHSQNQSAAELKGLIPSPGDLALENYDQP